MFAKLQMRLAAGKMPPESRNAVQGNERCGVFQRRLKSKFKEEKMPSSRNSDREGKLFCCWAIRLSLRRSMKQLLFDGRSAQSAAAVETSTGNLNPGRMVGGEARIPRHHRDPRPF